MMEGAQPEGCATKVFAQLVKPWPEESHHREDLECEASSNWVSRAFRVGSGCRGVR